MLFVEALERILLAKNSALMAISDKMVGATSVLTTVIAVIAGTHVTHALTTTD